ncbi:MAG: prepilin-type N-terminal cleavage/methylation domain-containing protein [Alphaproteobacteria bacterium]|nr:prepilin-type N-terminal cleavage/methylation domain-containing protein [Alphaproteobacteria bacterium]
MTKRHHQTGFTLVELAIVMVIIGLLIGGVLKGQQILYQARISSTIMQLNSVDGAAKTFYDTYNSSLPGDLLDAPNKIVNCPDCGIAPDTTLSPNACTSGTDGGGNGVIGSCVWDMSSFQSASYAGSPASGTPANETVLFWLELSRAGLISGITDDGLDVSTPASFGGSLPAAKVGGGLMVGYASPNGCIPGTAVFNDIPQPGGIFVRPAYAALPPMVVIPCVASTMPTGNVLVLANSPANLNSIGPGENVLSPISAAQMDTKLDDGKPDSGFVQGYGQACRYDYAPSNSKNCGIYFGFMRP